MLPVTGVSRRSIFYHFSDLGALYDAVVEVGMQRCAPLLEEIPRSATAAARVARLTEVCARFFEATTPFRRSMAATALGGPAKAEAVRVGRGMIKQQREFMNPFEQLRALGISVPVVRREGIPT